ncbi:GNAT family N-acetyltransferase [Streptomyces sp. CWNU-1]|uniref:GNAT family N-acetyltransferase n=1 Tax=Streptomyces albipurpureus TaxID=2897419 RepID=A0ABT0UTZ8_9ACTN|nr:GNAT family N-acetyltransferase [Streptomyces sp. CWNU-1]MCM2392062.1 GNAT family N-acetyltransferase [Streptomyces sp. CWNU-1]
MTDLLRDRTDSPPIAAAYAAAEAAAQAAGVDIRSLDRVSELEAVRRLYERIWRTGENSPPVTADLLRAMAKAGSYVSGVFDGDELVGSSFGFFSPPAREALHSHIAGVLPQLRRRNVGFALKLHQRAWAMARGVNEICWTYDPLVRRNAYFNIGKLAAEPAEYLPDFYGPIDDDINRSDDSDRILVRWHLESPDVESACAGRPRVTDAQAARAAGATVALSVSATGTPIAGRVDEHAHTVLVAVPEDIEALRESDPVCAARWRTAVREALDGLLADGARIRGFDRAGWYVVDRGGRPAPRRTTESRTAPHNGTQQYGTQQYVTDQHGTHHGEVPQETV